MLRSFQDLVKVLSLFPSRYEAVYYPRKTIAGDYDKLFDIMKNGNHQKEEDVAEELYGARDGKELTRYFTTKSRLKDRMEAGFFFLNTEKMPRSTAREYKLWKELLIARLLWSVGARDTAASRLEKLTQEAEALGLTDIAAFIVEHLRSHAARKGSMVLVNKYNSILRYLHIRKGLELRFGSALAEIEVFRSRETLLSEEHIGQSAQVEADIKRLHNENDCRQAASEYHADIENASAVLSRMLLKAAQYHAEARGNYTQCLHALDGIVKTTPLSSDTIADNALERLRYAFVARDNAAAERGLAELIAVCGTSAAETLTGYEYAFLTALRTESWDAALLRWSNALASTAFTRFASDHTLERWRVYEVYIRFLLQNEVSPRPTLFKPRFAPTKVAMDLFRAYSHPESVAEHLHIAQHSRSLAASVFIAECLRLASESDITSLQHHLATSALLQEKYLRKDAPNYRLQCFLRLLETASIANFDYAETLRKSAKYLDRLVAARTLDTVALHTMEALPFERVWVILLHALRRKGERRAMPALAVLRAFPSPFALYSDIPHTDSSSAEIIQSDLPT